MQSVSATSPGHFHGRTCLQLTSTKAKGFVILVAQMFATVAEVTGLCGRPVAQYRCHRVAAPRLQDKDGLTASANCRVAISRDIYCRHVTRLDPTHFWLHSSPASAPYASQLVLATRPCPLFDPSSSPTLRFAAGI